MTDSGMLATRYNILRTIGAGGMGMVYLVEDTRKNNQHLALKILRASGDAAAAERFRAEFRHVHGVSHPNLPEVYDFGTLPESNHALYFTSEFIDGKPLDTLQEHWQPHQLRTIIVALCRALAFLHSRSLLHRDIKPENVLAKLKGDEFQTIKLVDFGLAAHVSVAVQEIGGTIDYLAPELVDGGPASVATDIYALGMLLYRLAAGRLPFEAQDPLALTRQRSTTEAPPPLRFRPDLPVGLSDVICALIRLKPEDRPVSARHVIALLNEREGTEFPYEIPQTQAAYIHSSDSVTNTHARDLLKRHVGTLKQGGVPAHVFITALHGLGRTRTLTDFATELTLDGVTTRVIHADSDLDLGDNCAQVLLVPSVDDVSRGPLYRAIERAREANAWWIIAGDQLDPQLSEALGTTETIRMAPMGLDTVRKFVAATFPENGFPEDFADQLCTHALGLPGATREIFDRLLESGQLRIGLNGWELLPGSWNLPLHPHVVSYIEYQRTRLSSEALWLARLLSCSAIPLPALVVDNLAVIDQRSSDDLKNATEELTHLGWLGVNNGDLSLAFGAVSRYLYDQLARDDRRQLHGCLSAAWSFENVAAHPRVQHELLFHDVNAGSWSVPSADMQATLGSALQEGQSAWVRTLVDRGLANDPPLELRDVMLIALGNLEYIESNLAASADCYSTVLNGGTADISTNNINAFARYAVLEEKLGHTDHAEAMMRRCRDALPPGYDANAGTVYGTLAWIAFKRGEAEQARALSEEGLVRVPPNIADSGFALLLNMVATQAFYGGDLDAAAIAWKRCLEVNETIHDRKGVANMYNNLGVVAAQSGDRLRARSLWEKCEEIAREIHDMHRLGGIYNNLGIDSLETGTLTQAEEYYLKALAIFRRLRSPRDQVEILNNLGELSYYRADYARAQAYWQEAVRLAASVGDQEGQIEPLVYLGKLLSALEDLERGEATLRHARDLARELSVKKGEGQAWEGLAQIYCRRGDSEHTAEALRNANIVLSEEVDPLAALHLHLTECSIAAESGDTNAVQQSLSQARKVADIKWDPYTAARTLVYGLLFAHEQVDHKERLRVVRQLAVYPDLLWRFHWAVGRRLSKEGAFRSAREEYGRGVSVLKSIASRLSEGNRQRFLNAPQISKFRAEALDLRNMLDGK
jgi:tetratricopeptide (TPR) repeat protein